MDSVTKPRRYYLIPYPRTGSNLLLKILALDRQPNITTGEFDGGYFFEPVDGAIGRMGLQAKNVDDWTAEETQQVRDIARECFETLQRCVASAESEGHSLFIKEHTIMLADPTARSRLRYSSVREQPWTVDYDGAKSRSGLNFTLLPDEYLLKFLPIFLIRHPGLAFPSLYRTIVKLEGKEAADQDDYAALMITVEWSRSLYDFYVQNRDSLNCSSIESDQWPIIIDADDIMVHPSIVTELCDRTGMDPQKLQFSWDTTSEIKHPGLGQGVMRSTLYGSTGIIKDKVSTGLDIEAEAVKWEAEFGGPAAMHIKKLVQESLPHYEYLREKRLRPASVAQSHGGAIET